MQREVQIVVSMPIRLILIWNTIYSTLAYLLIISIQIRHANISCHCESNYIKQFFLLYYHLEIKESKNKINTLKLVCRNCRMSIVFT